ESDHGLDSLLEHDLFRKPVSTFRDHALVRKINRGERPTRLREQKVSRCLNHVADPVQIDALEGSAPLPQLSGDEDPIDMTKCRSFDRGQYGVLLWIEAEIVGVDHDNVGLLAGS